MFAIAIIIVSFITALLGVAHSQAAKPGERAYRGLTRLGLTLVVLASLGMVLGVAKEIGAIRSAQRAATLEADRTQMLKEIHAEVVGATKTTADPAAAARLASLADRISAAASLSRESDFSMSDFSRSDFTAGNFTQASFRDALFEEADLRGADLSGALIDDKTRLPVR